MSCVCQGAFRQMSKKGVCEGIMYQDMRNDEPCELYDDRWGGIGTLFGVVTRSLDLVDWDSTGLDILKNGGHSNNDD